MTHGPQQSPYDFADQDPAPAHSQPANPPKDSRTCLATQHACPYCGFAFSGKPRSHCPECSAPMDSGTTDLLQFADYQWVRQVAIGLMLLALPALAHAAGALLRWTHGRLAEGPVHVAAALLLAAAVFLATRPEPGKTLPRSTSYARALAIAAALAWVLLGLIALKLFASHGMTKPLVLLALLAQGILSAQLGIYCNSLAARVPDDRLASHSLYAGWLMAAACGLLMVVQALDLTTIVHLMFFMCSFPMIAGILLILLWAVVTLLRLGLNLWISANAGETITTLRRQRTAARQR